MTPTTPDKAEKVTMEMSLNEAMKLPFLEYIAWCHDHMAKASARDVLVKDLYHSGESRVFLEAMWAKRYWYYKNGVDL